MEAQLKPSFFDMYSVLPKTRQKQLEKSTRSYFASLDAAIADKLSPTVGKTEDRFLVCDDIIPLYGIGDTPQEAMEDYRSVLIEYYEGLEEEEDELDSALKKQLEILRQVFAHAEG